MAWKEAITVFFSFLNFFAIFLEFSITYRVETKRNDNFYFLSFSVISNLFSLEMNRYWNIWICWMFLLLFWNFQFSVGYERNVMIIFIFSLSPPFPTYFWPRRTPWQYFLIFWIFLLFFLEFSITRRVGTERNGNFYFLSFSAFSNLFWLEMKQ